MCGTSTGRRGGTRKRPWAFTEAWRCHGRDDTELRDRDHRHAARGGGVRGGAPRRGPGGGVDGAWGPRLQRTLERLLDTVVDQRGQTTVREEAQELIAQSIQHLKDRLGRPGLENEDLAARAAKLLAEAEAEVAKATAAKSQSEASEIEVRLLVRRPRLVMEAERAFAAGQTDAFLAVLADLGRVG